MEISEQVFQKGRHTVRPLCERLGLRAGGCSRGVEQAVVDFGAEDSFALAAQRLSRHHPVRLSATMVRKVTLQHAKAMEARQVKAASVGMLPAHGAADLVAEADGTMLPVVDFSQKTGVGADRRKGRTARWMEVRLCAVRAAGEVRAHYGCDGSSVESLGYQWAECAVRAGWGLESAVRWGQSLNVDTRTCRSVLEHLCGKFSVSYVNF